MTELEAKLLALGKVTTVNVEALLSQSTIQGVSPTLTQPTPTTPTKKPSKYRNKRVEVDGIKFDSQKEATRWQTLQAWQQAGVISDLQRQVRYKCVVNDHKICDYIADFVYTQNGKKIVEDVKSAMTRKLPVYRLKRRLMLAIHNVEITEV